MKVELRGAVARYGQREVLRGVDLSLAPGRISVVVGPNGSGKSTLIKVVAGLIGFEGQLLFDGSERRPGVRIARRAYDLAGCAVEYRITCGDAREFRYRAEVR